MGKIENNEDVFVCFLLTIRVYVKLCDSLKVSMEQVVIALNNPDEHVGKLSFTFIKSVNTHIYR